ncbi:MAG TPA: hypothetical protein VF669_13950 [Tepidisphaeraceae bacterium]|jgi:hypothetical protein
MKVSPLIIIFVAGFSSLASADTLWVLNQSGNEVPISEIRITGASGDQIAFEDSTGKRGRRELADVKRIEMDNEPALAGAERAYADHQWPQAVDAYRRVLAGTSREWLRNWVAPRLVDSAQNASNIPAAVEGYLHIVKNQPARAQELTPVIGEGDAKALEEAVGDVNSALTDATLSAQQKQRLLDLLVDLHRARHDPTAADAVLELMNKSGNQGAARAVVRKKLDTVAQLLQNQQWTQAKREITSSKSLFIEERDQAEAMFSLAEADAGLAEAETSTAKPRPPTQPSPTSAPSPEDRWKDVALAYMRVVSHFKDSPGAPYVAASLLKAAAIEERIGDDTGATRLYEQVATQFATTPAGASARAKLQRLKSP